MDDIRWFILVLGILLVAFSQSFLSILAGLNPPTPCDDAFLDELRQNITEAEESNNTNDRDTYLSLLAEYEDCGIWTHYKRVYEVRSFVYFRFIHYSH